MLLRLMLLLLFDLDVVVDVFLMSSFLDFFCFCSSFIIVDVLVLGGGW